jgi:hypothetical protein
LTRFTNYNPGSIIATDETAVWLDCVSETTIEQNEQSIDQSVLINMFPINFVLLYNDRLI